MKVACRDITRRPILRGWALSPWPPALNTLLRHKGDDWWVLLGLAPQATVSHGATQLTENEPPGHSTVPASVSLAWHSAGASSDVQPHCPTDQGWAGLYTAPLPFLSHAPLLPSPTLVATLPLLPLCMPYTMFRIPWGSSLVTIAVWQGILKLHSWSNSKHLLPHRVSVVQNSETGLAVWLQLRCCRRLQSR